MVKRHYGIVNKDFKLVHFYYDVDEWELYDRKNDPNEMKNVYNDPLYKQTVKKLTNELDKFLNFPTKDPHGDPIPNAKGEIEKIDKFLLSLVFFLLAILVLK